jgi:SAM-dependent methyltransferase
MRIVTVLKRVWLKCFVNDNSYKNVYTKHIAAASSPNEGVGGADEKIIVGNQHNTLMSNDYSYKNVYTKHIAAASSPNEGVGGADEKIIAESQLKILVSNGLRSHHKVYELGAGTGRILLSLSDFLIGNGARYLGIEIVQELVSVAKQRVARLGESNTKFEFLETSDSETFRPEFEPDFIFAFSVFTHMEAEDIVLKLKQLRQISKPETLGLFTFLPLEHAFGRYIFEGEMSFGTEQRYRRVRNIAFTLDMATAMAEISGWKVLSSYWDELESPYNSGKVETNQSWLLLKPKNDL